ncbi:MAG: hypothetical protein U0930_21510 [Pirellulales bacterium]
MLAVMSTDGDSLFLLSGAALSEGSDGKPVRRYLSDGYRYHPSSGWSKLADMPRAAVAAPSPAAVVRLEKSFRKSGSSKESSQPEIDTSAGIVVLGGDDGTKVDFRPIDQHPGFPSTALVYSIQHDSWLEVPMGISDSQVTTALIEYEKKLIIPSGEIRPGVRTSKVRQLELSVPR